MTVFAIFLSLVAFAAAPLPPFGQPKPKPAPPKARVVKEITRTLQPGAQIAVEEYDETTKMFLLELVDSPAVGPNYSAADPLRRAIDFQGDLDHFMKQLGQMKGSIYVTAKPLTLLSEEEVARREKKAGR